MEGGKSFYLVYLTFFVQTCSRTVIFQQLLPSYFNKSLWLTYTVFAVCYVSADTFKHH